MEHLQLVKALFTIILLFTVISVSPSLDIDFRSFVKDFSEVFEKGWDNTEYRGTASYYGKKYHGRKTSSGEIFDMNKLTAAHKTIPLGEEVKVTNLRNGKSVIVKINDRGPFAPGRIIDLSKSAALEIDMIGAGLTEVVIERL